MGGQPKSEGTWASGVHPWRLQVVASFSDCHGEAWWGQGHYSVMSRCLGLDRTYVRGQGAADPAVHSGRDGIKPETNECSSASPLTL